MRCVHGGEIVGVYEPVCVIEEDGRLHEGSRLTLGAELERPGILVVHKGCLAARGEPKRDGADPS